MKGIPRSERRKTAAAIYRRAVGSAIADCRLARNQAGQSNLHIGNRQVSRTRHRQGHARNGKVDRNLGTVIAKAYSTEQKQNYSHLEAGKTFAKRTVASQVKTMPVKSNDLD